MAEASSCWLKFHYDESTKGTILRIGEYYLILWTAIIFNIFAIYKVIDYLKRNYESNKETRFIKVNKLKNETRYDQIIILLLNKYK